MADRGDQIGNILVIDRDYGASRYLEQQLERYGYQVRLVKSVGHALVLLEKQERFDLALFLFDTPALEDLIVLRKLKIRLTKLQLIVCGPVNNETMLNYINRAKPDVVINRTCPVPELVHMIKKTIDQTGISTSSN